MSIQHVVTGAGAPTAAPPSVSAHYTDTTTGDQYLAKGTASAADWVLQVAGMAKADADAAYQPKGSYQAAGDYATTQQLTEGLSGKVNAVAGMGLSSNDFTAAEKTKISNLTNQVLALETARDEQAATIADILLRLAALEPTERAAALAAFSSNQLPYLMLFNAETMEPIAGVPADGITTYSAVVLSPDGATLVVYSETAPYLRAWNIADWVEHSISAQPADWVGDVAFSRDGSRLYAIGGGLNIYDTATWQAVSAPALTIGIPTKVSACEAYLAVAGTQAPWVQIIDRASGSEVPMGATLTVLSGVRGITFSPDGAQLAIALPGSDKPLVILASAGWTEIAGVPVVQPWKNTAYSPDGTTLAVPISAEPYLQLFDTTTWAAKAVTQAPPAAITQVAFSRDGSKAAVATGSASAALLYETATWTYTAFSTPGWTGGESASMS